MATTNVNQNSGSGYQVIGKVLGVQGSVQAESTDKSVRVLQADSPIFFNDRIITGANGMVSIVFSDGSNTQLDLGRMSDVVIDGDVLPGGEPVDFSEATAEVEQVQEALLTGEFDPTTDFEPTAAGPTAAGGPADDGGGSSYVEFSLTGEAITPTSGAETTGVGLNFLVPEINQFEEPIILAALEAEPDAPPAPAPAPAAVVPLADVLTPEIPPLSVDSAPLAGELKRILDEKNLDDGTHPDDSVQDESSDPDKLVTSGDLTDLGVDFGPDGPGSLTFQNFNGTDTETIVINGNTGVFVTVTGQHGVLVIDGAGQWIYTLNDNIVHDDPTKTGSEDTKNDPFSILVTDGNGTPAPTPGNLTIEIWDDGPVAKDAVISRVVEEEALDNYSPGNSPVEGSDGNPDEADGPEDADPTQQDASVVTGNLNSLVDMGADNPGTFSIFNSGSLPTLFSKGGTITYEMNANGTTLEAWVRQSPPVEQEPALQSEERFEEPEGQDRLIFSLDVQSNGDYTFTLYDQLDHVVGDGENTLLQGSDGQQIAQLALGSAIIATDSDGDSTGFVDTALTFTIVDDVPVLVQCGHAFFYVNEDALGNDNPPWNGWNNEDADSSTGNLEFFATDRAYFNLSRLVETGADEQLTWSLKQPVQDELPEEGVAVAALSPAADYASALTSNGDTVYYHVSGNTLTGYTGSPENMHVVFTFKVDSATGRAEFDLDDQLDHDAGRFADINTLQISDLGQFVVATDFDGDSVNLGESIVVAVENDVPVIGLARGKLIGEVQEDALGNENADPADNDNDRSDGNLDEKGVDTDTAEFSLSSLVRFSPGADDPASIKYGIAGIGDDGVETDNTSKGQNIWYFNEDGKLVARAGGEDGKVVFTFTVDSQSGEAVFNLNDQVDHGPDHLGDEGELAINLGRFVEVSIEDADGDTASVNFGNKIVVNVENDVPILTCERACFAVQEDALGNKTLNLLNNNPDSDNSKGNIELSSWFSTDHDSSNLSNLVEVGADERLTWNLAAPKEVQGDYKSNLTSNGNAVYYKVSGNTLTGYTNIATNIATNVMSVVFTFSVNAATGRADFNLNDQLDHSPGASGTDRETLSITDLGKFVNATDFDGDSVNLDGRIVVSVENDIPTLDLFHSRNLVGTVQEDALGNEAVDDADNDTDASKGNLDSGDDTDTAVFELAALIRSSSPGADDPAKITYKIGDIGEKGVPTVYTSNNQSISYFNEDGQLVAKAGGQVIFTFSVDSDSGKATFNLNDQIDHPKASGDDFNLAITNLGTFVEANIEDADGDVVSVDFTGKISVNVENDVPEVIETAQYFFISEYAGYNNTIGIYELDDQGNPTNPRIIVAESNDLANFSQASPTYFGGAYTEGVSLGYYEAGTKMFLIANGGGAVDENDKLAFRAKGDADPGDAPAFILQVERSGVWTDVNEAQGIYYMDSSLDTNPPGSFNGGKAPEGVSHFTDQWSQSPWPAHFINDVPVNGGEVRIEDLNFGDGDFDDTVLRVEKGAVVSESNLADGTGQDPNTHLMVSGNFFMPTAAGIQFQVGADEALTLNIASIGIPSLSGAGTAGDSGTIVVSKEGTAGTSKVFLSEAGQLEVWSNGDWQYTLRENTLKNPDNDKGASDKHDGDYDRFAADQVQDIFKVVATDTDGDSVETRFIVNINDDGPVIGNPQDAILANEIGNSLVADLNIEFGADNSGNVAIKPDSKNVGSGNKVVDNNGNYVSIGGNKLYWHDNGDGSWQAQTTAGIIGFVVAPETDLAGVTGNYTVDLRTALDQTTTTFNKSFGDNGGGNATIRDLYQGNVLISVTAIDPNVDDPDKVNWSTQGMGVGNQFIDLDDVTQKDGPANFISEQLVVKFFDTSSPGKPPLEMTEVVFGLDHLDKATAESNPDPAEIARWTAYNGNEIVGTGTVEGTSLGASDQADQFVTINETNTSGSFDKVVFSAENSITDYRITSVTGTYEEPVDIQLTFDVIATDGDGDKVASSFDVTFDADNEIEGTESSEVISGSSLADVISGGGGDDVIFGNGGDDTLVGGSGSDTLDGGAGEDVIFGGADSDVIVGGADDDILVGGTGGDKIDGGTGEDTLYGDAGNTDDTDTDTLTGGPDKDTFVDPGNNDTLVDYSAGTDIELETLVPPPEEPII